MALLRLDGDGRILDANDTFLAWAGGDGPGERPDVRGRRLSDLLTVGGRIYWETHLAPFLTLQGRVDEVAVELRTPAGPLPVLLSLVARRDERQAVVDVALFAARERVRFDRELVAARTAAEEAAERLHWVHDALTVLSRAATVPQVEQALTDSVARHPAIAAAALHAVGAGHGGPGQGRAGHGGEALATGDDAIQGGTAGGAVVVPVAGTGETYAHLEVTLHGRPGDPPLDHEALRTIAQQGGVALERALLHEQSVSVAHELQRAMLTQDLPSDGQVEVLAEYRPAVSGLEVGGDWYDAFPVDDTTLAVAVGDVVGHGLHAATAMGQLRTATRALAAPGLGPAGTLGLVDQFVARRKVGYASTLVYAELDTVVGTLRYACAGHLPPLLVRVDGTVEYLWGGRSSPLGVPAGGGLRAEGEVRLAPGDVVLFYTDGVVERRDRRLRDGLDQLARVAARRDPVDEGDVLGQFFDLEANQRDDACVLHVAWRGTGAVPAVEVPADVGAVAGLGS
ncbi:hypothetical protein DNL40_02775 [Xylanimonas oleitrophica]|uniref:PPM-type phosphatase domain-containing protein n=1 Tax=Xylanimonas oleitrophica TaxID=2607479 RepID=A0A2W5WXB0_9MICO|nr:SpoIIE family protein phosphatase [Xylanimonas oleitrophica]PZR55313.1 hypothetical protein DNL40_02775 [Xylanimonas oleitrophica]